MYDQTMWRGRIARKWMHRERKRWKKAARSLHAEVFSNWFDNTDRYVHDHEVKSCYVAISPAAIASTVASFSTRIVLRAWVVQDSEWKWPYEQSEEWRGNIHAAYLAGKEVIVLRSNIYVEHHAFQLTHGVLLTRAVAEQTIRIAATASGSRSQR